MNTITTNEWTPVTHGYPPTGRPVLVRLEWHVPRGRTEEHFMVAIFNGLYWIDPLTMSSTPLLKEGIITDWYMYEKYIKTTNND